MRRAGNLWPRVASFPALVAAAHTAARGKRSARSVAPFLERVEVEALQLERELRAGAWRPSPVERFEVCDPKLRTITVTPFRDQVVHHALMAAVAPVFERRMLADSYACRKGRGQHAAVRRAQRFLRRHAYFLKLDVASFFASVRHDVALDAVARAVKDRQVHDLFRTVLRGPPGEPDTGVGLPLGALTSQWLANLVLDRLDHLVKEGLRVPGYVRYMDDCVLFADERARLRDAQDVVTSFLHDPLGLAPKERATMLAPATAGLPFLGWMVHRATQRVRPENLRRYRWRWRLRRRELEQGRRTTESYRQSVASLFELLHPGDTLALRRAWVARTKQEI